MGLTDVTSARRLGTAIGAVAAGDADAPNALVGLATPIARQWAARLVDPADVDDVVQEALVEVLATAARLRHPEAATTWVRLIVRKHAERHRRRHLSTAPLAAAPDVTDGGLATADLVEAIGDVALVRRALAAASSADRQLLVLHYHGGWTDRELAELLGISPGAVRKRLHDARRRLRRDMTDATHGPSARRPERTPMFDPTQLLGTSTTGDDLAAQLTKVPAPAPLEPAGTELLATGLRVIDGVVPWRRGGTVDMLGPAGTGQLVLLCEVVHNLCAQGPAAIVAVAADPEDAPSGSSRLHRLTDPEAMPEVAVVITSDAAGAVGAFASATAVAAALAELGYEVLLVIDRTTGEAVGPTAFAGRTGHTGEGSVTGVRVAPHARDADPVAAWTTDAVTTFGTEQFVLGQFPAIDVLASRSRLVDDGRLPEGVVGTANTIREHLATAARIRARLGQALWVAEAYTGVPGEAVDPPTATAELAAAVAGG